MQNTEAMYCSWPLRSYNFHYIFDKLAGLEAELDALKQKLRDLFGKFAAFAESRYNDINETFIYKYLLGFEEGRLSDFHHKVQVEQILGVDI